MKLRKLKRWFSMFLTVVMIMTMTTIPENVNAEETGGGTTEAESVSLEVSSEKSFSTAVANMAEADQGKKIVFEMKSDMDLTQADVDAIGANTVNTNGNTLTVPKDSEVTIDKEILIVNTVEAEGTDRTVWEANHVVLSAEGTLTINGGNFKTAAVQLLDVSGKAVINGGVFACTKVIEQENSNDDAKYDGATLISVSGASAELIMTKGIVNANVGYAADCGMYGIYVLGGGTVTLGKENGDNNELSVNSRFAAVGMNYTTAPGMVTIYSGQYGSHMSCDKNIEKFNAVLYFPASASVNIYGGEFIATEDNENMHVISMPYATGAQGTVRLNLKVFGGTFKIGTGVGSSHQGSVFYYPNQSAENNKVKVSVTGGKFQSDISKELPESSFETGKKVYDVDGDGLYEVADEAVAQITVDNVAKKYSDLTEAIAAAKAANTKVELIANTTLTKDIDLTDVTIDTKGFMITIPTGETVNLTGGTIKNTVVAEDSNKENGPAWNDNAKNKTMFKVDGTLNINGGTYTTKGVYMIVVNGTATIDGGANLSCNAESNEIGSLQYNANYDGAGLINVSGSGDLKVLDATLNSNVGNTAKTDGMYGIYVFHGGALTLGDGTKNPTIDSMFAPVSMNGITAPGTIVINGGTYTSNAECEAEGIKKYNAVLFLPAQANVTINGGTFEAKGSKGEQHVISIPYRKVPGSNPAKIVTLNLNIEDGIFKAGSGTSSAIFYDGETNVEDADIHVNIRGGKFDKNTVAHIPTDGCRTLKAEAVDGLYELEKKDCTIAWIPEKAATCWAEGVIGHYECTSCGKLYATKTGGDFTGDVYTPKKQHTVGESKTTSDSAANVCEGDIILKDYVKCTNCGLYYDNAEKLEKDTDGSLGTLDSTQYVTEKKGHIFEGENIEIDTTNVKVDFTKKTITGITAKVPCTNSLPAKEEGSEEAAAEETSNVHYFEDTNNDKIHITTNVTSWGTGTDDCTQKRTVTYNVTVMIDVSDSSTIMKTFTNQTTEVAGNDKHSVNTETIRVNTEAFDIATYKQGEENGVTVTAFCADCGKEVVVTPAVTYVGTVDSEGTVTQGTEDDLKNLSCQTTYQFKVTVTSEGAAKTAETVYEGFITRTGTHQLGNYNPYKAPSCTEAGHSAYYQCTTCNKYYTGEDDARTGKGKTLEEMQAAAEIPMLSHNFAGSSVKFEWTKTDLDTLTGAETEAIENAAKMTITCSDCGTVFTKEGLSVSVNASSDKPACGTEATLKYDVSYKFVPAALAVDESGNLVVDETKYNELVADAKNYVEYKKTLEHVITKKHTFGSVKITWSDTVTDELHNLNAIKAVISCGTEGCDDKFTLTYPGIIVDNESSMLDDDDSLAFLQAMIVLEKTNSKPATCSQFGEETYNVFVKYRNAENKMVNVSDEPTVLTRNIPKVDDAHSWTEPKVTWTEVQDTDGSVEMVEATVTDSTTGEKTTASIPNYEIEASYYCTNGCATDAENPKKTTKTTVKDLIGKKETTEGTQEAADTATEPHVTLDVTYTSGNCIVSTKAEYNVRVFDGEKEITTKPVRNVYTKEGPGHHLVVNFDWKYDDTNKVYTGLTVTRTCDKCPEDLAADSPYKYPEETFELDLTGEGTPATEADKENLVYFDSEQNTTFGTMVRVKKWGVQPTCTTSGEVSYEANLGMGNGAAVLVAQDLKVVSYSALGHDAAWSIVWTEDESKDATDSTRFTAVKQKKCQRAGCTEAVISSEDLELDYEITKQANCTETGTATWSVKEKDLALTGEDKWADSMLVKEETAEEGTTGSTPNFAEGTVSKTAEIPVNPENHKFTKATVTWDEAAMADGSDTVNVTVTRGCDYDVDKQHDYSNELFTQTLTATKTADTTRYADGDTIPEGKQVGDIKDDFFCSDGYTYTYTISDTEKEKVKDWDMSSDVTTAADTDASTSNEWYVKAYTVEAATGKTNHVLKYHKGQAATDCTGKATPTYYECTRCHKNFKSMSCDPEQTYSAEEIQGVAAGHLYGEPTFSWQAGSGNTVALAEFECQRCHEKMTETVKIDESYRIVAVAPKCEDSPDDLVVVEGEDRTLERGQGYDWIAATVNCTDVAHESTFTGGTLNEDGSRTYEGMLYQVVDAVPHHFVNGKCEWCGKEREATAIFYGRDEATEIASVYLTSTNISDISTLLPAAPNQIGYQFLGWSLTAISTEADSNIADSITTKYNEVMADATDTKKEIKVYAVYAEQKQEGNVSITYVSDSGEVLETVEITEQPKVGERYVVTAPENIEGKNLVFSHWEMNGETVGVEVNYAFYIVSTNAVELKAVYASNKIEAEPSATITETYISVVSGKNKISFSATVLIPEGYTAKEVGMLYNNTGTVMTDVETNMTIEQIGKTVNGVVLPHKQYTFKNLNLDTYVLTVNVTDKEDYMLQVRPYVIATDKDGNQKVFYGKVKEDSFNSHSETPASL